MRACVRAIKHGAADTLPRTFGEDGALDFPMREDSRGITRRGNTAQ